MSATIINLIIQIIAGAVGGNAVGAASKVSQVQRLSSRCIRLLWSTTCGAFLKPW